MIRQLASQLIPSPQMTPIPMPSGYELHVFHAKSEHGLLQWLMLGPPEEVEAGETPPLRAIVSTGRVSSVSPHDTGALDRSDDEWIGRGFVPPDVLSAMTAALRARLFPPPPPPPALATPVAEDGQ